MKNNALEIPYRLETTEEVDITRGGGIIGEVDYKRLLHYAKEKPLQRPYALINARKKVTKDFTLVDENKIREAKISIREVVNLLLVNQYPLILESTPWIDDIVSHEDIFSFFLSFPPDVRKHLLLEHGLSSPSLMYASMLAIRKLLKKCLFVYVKAQKTTTLSLLQLKQSLVALTVFDPRNEDVQSQVIIPAHHEPDGLFQSQDGFR